MKAVLSAVALVSLLSLARGDSQQATFTLTSLTQAGYNQTTHSASVRATWTANSQYEAYFTHFRVKCEYSRNKQHNKHRQRIKQFTQQNSTIEGLITGVRYTCCVEIYFKYQPKPQPVCNSIILTPPNEPVINTITDTTSPTEHAQTDDTGSQDSPDNTGLYVVIALLCVLLGVCAFGWMMTGLVAYYKLMEREREFKGEAEINPHNHIHNPLYTSHYVPSDHTSNQSTINNRTVARVHTSGPGEYEYVRVGFNETGERVNTHERRGNGSSRAQGAEVNVTGGLMDTVHGEQENRMRELPLHVQLDMNSGTGVRLEHSIGTGNERTRSHAQENGSGVHGTGIEISGKACRDTGSETRDDRTGDISSYGQSGNSTTTTGISGNVHRDTCIQTGGEASSRSTNNDRNTVTRQHTTPGYEPVAIPQTLPVSSTKARMHENESHTTSRPQLCNLGISNNFGLPLHYETMASYGAMSEYSGRVAYRVDTDNI